MVSKYGIFGMGSLNGIWKMEGERGVGMGYGMGT